MSRDLLDGPPVIALGAVRPGFVGRINSLSVSAGHGGIAADELERRLLELGFVEGAPVEVLHEGAFGRDPIAVRVHGVTIGLRRREAMAIMVEPAGAGASPPSSVKTECAAET